MSDWTVFAACQPAFNGGRRLGHLFFAEDPETRAPLLGPASPKAYAEAKAICARCTVRKPCLADAMATEQQGARHGVRGGLTSKERDAIDSSARGVA